MIQTIDKNKYKITIDCGNINGKRKRISRTFIGNKKEARLTELKLKEEVNNKKIIIQKKYSTFNDLIEVFINDYCKTNVRENTLYGYKSLLVVIKKELGDCPIDNINTYTLQRFYNKLKIEYKFSSNTISHYYVLINNIFKKSINWEFISINPNEKIEKPKIIKKEKKIYDYDDLKKLKIVLNNYPLSHSLPILLCIDSGLRKEEINGLQWKDIDFEKKLIDINKVRIAVGKKIIIEEPKTVNSKRIISISEYIINLLKTLKNEQKILYKSNNKKISDDNYIFINNKCEPYYPDTIPKIFQKIIKSNNLKKITFHELRHTSTSLLIDSNIDIKSISKRLGHSNVSTTLNIYSHMLDKTNIEIANKMNEILINN